MKHKSIVFTVLVALVAIFAGLARPTPVYAKCLALSGSSVAGKPFLYANTFQATAGNVDLAIIMLGRVPVGNQDVSRGSSSGGGSAGGH